MNSRIKRSLLSLLGLEARITPNGATHDLEVSSFFQPWNNASLITANDDWSNLPSIVGYLGDDTIGEGVDPQTILTPYSTVDVIANQGTFTANTSGGVAEFDGFSDRVVALQADGNADAPNLVVHVNTTGRTNISMFYTLRDMDGTPDNAVQPVALQYRIGNAGNFINIPAGFVADATLGPSAMFKATPVSVTLPAAVNNQPEVQLRIITTNAVGDDEWVGVDDIVVGSRDFAINTFTAVNQLNPAVAMDADGDTIVTWDGYGPGENSAVFGQRFSALGVPVGGEFRINTYTTGTQTLSSAAMDADGDTVVVWQSNLQDSSGDGIYGQRFDAAGMMVGGEFRVNTNTTGQQRYPKVAMDADGDTLVTWSSSHDGLYHIYGQRYNATGMPVGGESLITTNTASTQRNATVAMDVAGNAIVVWETIFQPPGSNDDNIGIYGQRFNAAGMPVGGEFHVNTFTSDAQRFPSVAMDADGDALVTWISYGQADPLSGDIFAQRFTAAGTLAGAEFRINTYTTNQQNRASAAMDADGDCLVTWHSDGQEGIDGGSQGIYAQRYDAAGTKVGVEFQVNTYTPNAQSNPSVALDANGLAFVAWQSSGQDGSGIGVYGQRFTSPNSPPPAMLTSIQVNGGLTQRSMVTSLQVTFDSKVSFTGSPSAAFTLVNQKTGNPATLAAVVDVSGTVVTLTFTGGSVDLGGSLSDGRYTLSILANHFAGSGYDGNGDGTPGDDYSHVGAPGTAPNLFRIFGDVTGDGSVASNDFIVFRQFFNGSNSALDFDNDGAVAASDFVQFRQRFNGSI